VRSRTWVIAAGLWAIIIMVLSFIPCEELPSISLWEADKLAHAFVYMVLFIFMSLSFIPIKSRVIRWKSIFFTLFLCILFGLCIELIQGELIESRTFDKYDLLANTIGCLLGVTGIIFIFKPY
jgi:VanZ family protein